MSNITSSFNEITAQGLKEYLDRHRPGEYQLLDVRQPKEYQQQHLPGAVLIPLNDLPDRYSELDPQKETIVYCRSGMRSKAACQILTDRQFKNVSNMTGGILSWREQTAMGSEETGLDFFLQRDFENVFELAYNVEAGLQSFYQVLASQASNRDIKELLEKLGRFEDAHKEKLRIMHERENPGAALNIDQTLAEGGITIDTLLQTFGSHVKDTESVIQLAMMFEAQAFDLYSRLARRAESRQLADFYLKMAAEEQGHLNKLASELDAILL